MKKIIVLSFALPLIIFSKLTSCSPTDNDSSSDNEKSIIHEPKRNISQGKVQWLRDSTGGSHPDTLLVMYPRRDCTYAPITIMMLSDSTGGSQQDTTFVSKVVLKRKK